MAKRIKVIAVIITVLITYGTFRVYTIHKIQSSTEHFLTSVATGQTENINAVGEILWRIKSSENLPVAEVVNLKVHTMQFNRHWAKTQAVIELVVNDNISVNWYEVDLVNNNGWKVISVKEGSPKLIGVKGFCNDAQAKDVFRQYLASLTEQKPDLTHLAGQLRTASENIMRVPVGKIENIQLESLYGNSQFIVSKANYLVNEKPVSCIVSFYKSTKGWKIVSVQAL